MTEIKGFRGIRYKMKDITPVLCPPYDVVSPEMRKQLIRKSQYNLIRIELPDSYEDADRKLRSWQKKGVMIRDKEPSIYVCRQEFSAGGKDYARTGFFCAMKLDQKKTLKHEKVSLKPIGDRLSLMKSVRGNISPIFCLFEDGNNSIKKKLKAITAQQPGMKFKDSQGLAHKLWVVNDGKIIASIGKNLQKKKALIADGHHRFTTASTYLAEKKKKNPKGAKDAPYSYVLTFLCPLDDDGMIILPTHRVVRMSSDIWSMTKSKFNIKQWNGKGRPPIVRYHSGRFEQLVPKRKTNDISVRILHSLLLDRIYKKEDIRYIKDSNEAVQLADKMGGMAFLLDAPDPDRVYGESKRGKIMPHKTTYFYPKIPAGAVIYSFRDQ